MIAGASVGVGGSVGAEVGVVPQAARITPKMSIAPAVIKRFFNFIMALSFQRISLCCLIVATVCKIKLQAFGGVTSKFYVCGRLRDS
jgi:hypothetical protein